MCNLGWALCANAKPSVRMIQLIQFLSECGMNGMFAVDARAGISSQMMCPRKKGIVPKFQCCLVIGCVMA